MHKSHCGVFSTKLTDLLSLTLHGVKQKNPRRDLYTLDCLVICDRTWQEPESNGKTALAFVGIVVFANIKIVNFRNSLELHDASNNIPTRKIFTLCIGKILFLNRIILNRSRFRWHNKNEIGFLAVQIKSNNIMMRGKINQNQFTSHHNFTSLL